MAVTDTDPGTKVETPGQETPGAEAQTPGAEQQVSPEDEPRYSQKQWDAFAHQMKSDSGRVQKELETARDNLQARVDTATSQIEDVQAERDSLQTQIEGLTENDPKKFDLVKQDKDLRARERKYKENLRTLEGRETNVNSRLEKAETFELEVLIETVADEYEDGDKDQLKRMTEATGAKTEEDIRRNAEILWGKSTPKGEKKTPLKKVSGETKGGGTESLEDLLEQAKHLKGKTPAEIDDLQKKIDAARKRIT